MALAKLLRAAGISGWRRQQVLRFRVRRSELKVHGLAVTIRPDFVFPKQRVAVFVDGCFWHGCPKHSPPAKWLRKSAMPVTAAAGPRAKKHLSAFAARRIASGAKRTGKRFWREKLAANKRRDRLVNRQLRRQGWRVLRIWEHELAGNPACCVRRIREALIPSTGMYCR